MKQGNRRAWADGRRRRNTWDECAEIKGVGASRTRSFQLCRLFHFVSCLNPCRRFSFIRDPLLILICPGRDGRFASFSLYPYRTQRLLLSLGGPMISEHTSIGAESFAPTGFE